MRAEHPRSEAVKKLKITKNPGRKLLITNGHILRFLAFCQFFHSFSRAPGQQRQIRKQIGRPASSAAR
jgi:hypothetical protein